VAGRTDRDVHRTVRAEDDRAGPVATAPRKMVHIAWRTTRHTIAAEWHAHHAIGVGDVEVALVKGESVRLRQPGHHFDDAICLAVVIRIGETDDTPAPWLTR